MSAPETKTFTVAMGQILVEGGKPAQNIARAISAIENAMMNGADIVVLPEVLDCGWCDESARQEAEPIPGGTRLAQLCRAAAEAQVYVCAGLTERDGDEIYNSAVLLSPIGELLLKHRKVHELAIAKHLYSTGKSAQAVCETNFGMIGIHICADAFFPGEALTRSLAAKGAQLILSPCAWAVPPDHDNEKAPYGALWRDVYGRVASECGVSICGTSNVGTIRHGSWAGHHCIGCSMLVGPDGVAQTCAPYGRDAQEIVYAPISL